MEQNYKLINKHTYTTNKNMHTIKNVIRNYCTLCSSQNDREISIQRNQSLLINITKIRGPNFEAFNNPLLSNKVLSGMKILCT